MLHLAADEGQLGDQLMAVARDPVLRRSVYERLGEYCHQCRNRLNSLKLSLYLGRRGAPDSHAGIWDGLDEHYLKLERLVERIQVICRPMALNRVTVGLDLLVDDRIGEWSRLLEARGGVLVCSKPAERAVVSLDVDRIVSALDALAVWRAGACAEGTTTRLRWWSEAGVAHLVWEEDQPAGATSDRPDPTWTLPNLARVVAAHDGDLRLNEREGWRLDLTWPAIPN